LIRIPEHVPGLETLLYELATFPDGKYDDQVDAVSVIGANRRFVLDQARRLADRYDRWAPEERARLAQAGRGQPPPPQWKPHEQRFRLRRGLPI
jgi:hypothetical protein